MPHRSVFDPFSGALLVLAACGAPAGPAAGPPAARMRYVASGADGTVTRPDARDGRPLGRAAPSGPRSNSPPKSESACTTTAGA
jgi:hypothetical protein